MKLHLGFIVKNNKLQNHRSLLKLVFNPILRCFGICIGTSVEKELPLKVYGLKLMKCSVRINIFKNFKDSWVYEFNDDMLLINFRKWW